MRIQTIVSILCLIIGGLFFLIQQNWVLIHWSFGKTYHTPVIKKDATWRKPIKLYFWKNEKYNTEDATILWNDQNTTHNLKQIVQHWLICNQDEKNIKPSTTHEGVVLSTFGQAYLSFNQSILSKEWSIHKKWSVLESLFKTIRTTDIQVQALVFLVNNEPMEDDHIDFSQPFPIGGYQQAS